MKRSLAVVRCFVHCVVMLLPAIAAAAPVGLATAPELGLLPPPNVIVALGDSAGLAVELKAALREAFSANNLPGGGIRLAWQAIGGCRSLPDPGARCLGRNAVGLLDDARRREFMDFVGRMGAAPDADAVQDLVATAGQYLGSTTLGVHSPWAATPGTNVDPVAACRKAHLILATGGITPESTRSIADLALHLWSTDLQPGIANSVQTRMPFSASGEQDPTDEANPRNDPANWQHLSIHTIALGNDDAALAKAAANSRGRYAVARNSRQIAEAFGQILGSITAERQFAKARVATSIAASAGSTRNAVQLFGASFEASQWSGEIAGFSFARGAAAATPGLWGASGAGPNTSASLLDNADPDRRVLISSRPGAAGAQGIAWRWSQLSATQQATLNTGADSTDNLGARRLLYLRGDRSSETKHGGPFRDRASRQGDSVNSRIWFTPGKPSSGYSDHGYDDFSKRLAARAAMIYVGANDGLLHGFDAATGQEKLGYVPQGVYPKLSLLSEPYYRHEFFVDGSPFTGDWFDGTKWRTALAGFNGRGGKGYFILDVTDPTAFAEANAASLVQLDTTAPGDPDIGHIVSEPVLDPARPMLAQQITRLNNKRWAVVMGNGINSANEHAVLLIQYLDGARELLKIATDSSGSNGLSAPRLVDLNGDGVPDVAYAGDLRGQIWKFDLGSAKASDWNTAFNGNPMYAAQDASGQPQPITTAPVWVPHPEGGLMLVFGTGRDLSDADHTDTSTQSIYGIRDAAPASASALVPAGHTALVAQSIAASPVGSTGEQSLWTSSTNAVSYSGANGAKGWFIDLPVAGERVTSNPFWFEGKLIDIPSHVPASAVQASLPANQACEAPHERAFATTLNAVDGNRPKSQLYGAAADAFSASRIELRSRGGVSISGFSKEQRFLADGGLAVERQRLGHVARQPSWHQLQ